MRTKLKNVPIPEAHVIGFLIGVLLHLLFRTRIFHQAWIGGLIGWTLIILGTGLSFWAVFEAGDMDISSPTKLVTSGPYAFSRNPMYVGWSLIYLGISFVVNSIWLIALFPLVMIYFHLIDVHKEEIFLKQEFGSR